MSLSMKKITFTSADKQKIKAIYHAAFRKEDRMPFVMMQLMACLKSTDFLAFYDGEQLCGFIYMATIRRITFVMFFAVDQNMRSKGYGSGILNHIQARYPENKIIVTIERCDEAGADFEERLRRKKFYQANGYRETGYLIKLGKQTQEILIKNGAFDKRALMFFFLRYSNLTIIPRIWKKAE